MGEMKTSKNAIKAIDLSMWPDREDFMGRMVDAPDTNGCRIFRGTLNNKGYGVVFHNCRVVLAHRLAYMQHKGEIPVGMVVMHKCDVPGCCEPSHLFAGTQSDNVKDMWSKGRGKAGQKAKLGELDFEGIKLLHESGVTQKMIGFLFGVSQAAISQHLKRMGLICVLLGLILMTDCATTLPPVQHPSRGTLTTYSCNLGTPQDCLMLREAAVLINESAGRPVLAECAGCAAAVRVSFEPRGWGQLHPFAGYLGEEGRAAVGDYQPGLVRIYINERAGFWKSQERAVITHELMHALGFRHIAADSIMSVRFLDQGINGLTSRDVKALRGL
jgi:hypothetical protein